MNVLLDEPCTQITFTYHHVTGQTNAQWAGLSIPQSCISSIESYLLKALKEAIISAKSTHEPPETNLTTDVKREVLDPDYQDAPVVFEVDVNVQIEPDVNAQIQPDVNAQIEPDVNVHIEPDINEKAGTQLPLGPGVEPADQEVLYSKKRRRSSSLLKKDTPSRQVFDATSETAFGPPSASTANIANVSVPGLSLKKPTERIPSPPPSLSSLSAAYIDSLSDTIAGCSSERPAVHPSFGIHCSVEENQKTIYQGLIDHDVIHLWCNNQQYIFPFVPSCMVKEFSEMVLEETGFQVQILNNEKGKYTKYMPLEMIKLPFSVCLGMEETYIAEKGVSAITSIQSLVKNPALPQAITGNDDDNFEHLEGMLPTFRIINTLTQAITFMETIHMLISRGRAKSVNDALKLLNKDRKSVDRFKHLYYLNCVNSEGLVEVSREWKEGGQRGGLQKLSESAKEHIDWDRLEKMSQDGLVTIYGKNRP